MAEEYVQDFDGRKADEKTILERKVMEGKELSIDDKLIIIRALEKAGNGIFNSNQDLTVGGYNDWYDPNKITYRSLSWKPTCDTTTAFNNKNED